MHKNLEEEFVKPFVLSFSTSHYGQPFTFGAFIRRASLEKGLRQKDLAEAVGRGKWALSRGIRSRKMQLHDNGLGGNRAGHVELIYNPNSDQIDG